MFIDAYEFSKLGEWARYPHIAPMKMRQLIYILSDGRFLSIVRLLNQKDRLLAIYLVRLVTGASMVFAKKYLSRTDKFLKRCRNPLQYKEF